jgi:hypothetical protein
MYSIFKPYLQKKTSCSKYLHCIVFLRVRLNYFQRRLTVYYLAHRSSNYTVKKGYRFPVPSRDVTHQTLPGRA